MERLGIWRPARDHDRRTNLHIQRPRRILAYKDSERHEWHECHSECSEQDRSGQKPRQSEQDFPGDNLFGVRHAGRKWNYYRSSLLIFIIS